MKRSRSLWAAGAAAALLVAVPAGWYFGSPWWTLWRIREAARAGDVKTLAHYVDFEAVVRNGAAEARTSWTALIPMIRADSEGRRRLVALVRRKISEAEQGSTFGVADLRPWMANIPIRIVGGRRGDPYVVHTGFDSFEVRDRGMSLEHGPLLTFRRHGLGWRLERVRWGQQ